MASADPRSLIEAVGARATMARLLVLATLLKAQEPLSHQDVLREIAEPMDRVTVYRVLEWLAEAGIAHKITADDRTFRFAVAAAPHCHAHFHCDRCHRVFCLEEASLVATPGIPVGFRFQSVEVSVRGICATCVAQESAIPQ